MAALNESNVERKLLAVSTTQDSIQSLSLWVIHHKAHHEKIVSIWLKVLKKSNAKHRLTLFYLCNDIVQTCKRKHAIVYKDAFKEILKEAVVHVRDAAIRSNIERILKIWSERNVYDKTFIEELEDILSNSTSRSVITRLLAEFQPEQALEKVSSFKKLEGENDARKAVVSSLRIDAASIEAIRQLKDRDKGREYSQQFEDGCLKLEEFIAHTEIFNKERVTMIELLERSELFYDAQYSEAKIVANAYKNFGTRVTNLKKKLDEFVRTLPSPIPSPVPDAPSPEQSPTFAGQQDNTEAIDMEMSDSDNDMPPVVETNSGPSSGGSRGRRDSTTTTKAYPKPIASVTEIHMRHKSRKRKSPEQGEDFNSIVSSGSKASFLDGDKDTRSTRESWKAFKASHSPQSKPPPPPPPPPPAKTTPKPATEEDDDRDAVNPISVVSQSAGRVSSLDVYGDRDEGDDTPVKDELSSTPVQDEGPDEDTVANPIEFLTQLINQTKKANQTTGPSFLQTLSALQPGTPYSNSTDSPDGKPADQSPSSTGAAPSSWTAWKAAQNAPPPPPPPPVQPPVVPQQPAYAQSVPPPPPPPPPPHQQQPPYPPNEPPTPPAYGHGGPPMMVPPPPPFPGGIHGLTSPPPQQMTPQPVPAPTPQAVPPPSASIGRPPPPPPMPLPIPPPNMTGWPAAPAAQIPGMVPPPTPPSSNNMSPPASSGYNLSLQQPQTPSSMHQPTPTDQKALLASSSRTMKGSSRPRLNSSNLTEVPVIDDSRSPEAASGPSSSSIIPLAGGSGSGRPSRPSFPPTSPGAAQGSRIPLSPGSVGTPLTPPQLRTVTEDQQEFIDKLKRKSSVSTSPTTAPTSAGLSKTDNLRTLTEIKPDQTDLPGAPPGEEPPASAEEPQPAAEQAPIPVTTASDGQAAKEDNTPTQDSASTDKTSSAEEMGGEPSERPAQRIQSVASRVVSRIETTSDRRYDSYGYDRRDNYGEPYHRDRSQEQYGGHYGGDRGYGGYGGDRYGGYNRPRDPYYRESYGRSPPKRPPPPPSYDRRTYYQRY